MIPKVCTILEPSMTLAAWVWSPPSTSVRNARSSTDAIEVLVNLNHRGAVGAEENTGDGAGILMSMPDEFMRATGRCGAS